MSLSAPTSWTPFPSGPSPRRSGKTLAISWYAELCPEHQDKYPVIAVTLKDLSANSCPEVLGLVKEKLGNEARRHRAALFSGRTASGLGRLIGYQERPGYRPCVLEPWGEKAIVIEEKAVSPSVRNAAALIEQSRDARGHRLCQCLSSAQGLCVHGAIIKESALPGKRGRLFVQFTAPLATST